MDQDDLVGKPGEERGLLEGGITTAHDHDLLPAEEEAIAGGTGRHPMAEQAILAWNVQHQSTRTGRQDDHLGLIGGLLG